MGVGRVVRGFAIAGLLLAPCACHSAGQGSDNVSCSSRGICPNDQPPTSESIAVCEDSLDDMMCGAKFQLYINCTAMSEKCSPDGTEDASATLAASALSCADARETWNVCARAEFGPDGGSSD
jgi:hypothetical protein